MAVGHIDRASGLPPELLRRPFAVLRPADARDVYSHPSNQFIRLTERGLLHKTATGYYAIVPPASVGRSWLPGLEAVAYGIGAADYGPGATVLMGLSAARLHGALPRALGIAVVAVPKNRPALSLADRQATVLFVRRDTDRLDAERLSTELGPALVTSVEQTLLDLARRPELGNVPAEARESVRALWPRADVDRLTEIAHTQRLRSSLTRARDWAEA